MTRNCECGDILGERCQWRPRPGDPRRVRLVYVPEALRGTAEAAGTIRGVTHELFVERSCAEQLLADPWIMRPARARRLRVAADRAALTASVAAVLRRRS